MKPAIGLAMGEHDQVRFGPDDQRPARARSRPGADDAGGLGESDSLEGGQDRVREHLGRVQQSSVDMGVEKIVLLQRPHGVGEWIALNDLGGDILDDCGANGRSEGVGEVAGVLLDVSSVG